MSNLVRVGNVVEFADVENNLGAQPLSNEMLSSGYVSLDGSELSIENLQVSSGSLTYGTALGDTYGTYFLDFESGFTGEITLIYDIVNSAGESVTVQRTLDVVDNVSDTSGSFAPSKTRADGVTIDQFWRGYSDSNVPKANLNSSTYVREFTLRDGDNVDRWDPQLVQQGGSARIYRQQFSSGLVVADSPDVENTLTNGQILNLTAQNGTFSATNLRSLNGATTIYTPDPGFAGYDTITFDLVNLDGESIKITKTIEVVPTDYSSLTIEEPEASIVNIKADDPSLNDFLIENGAGYYRLVGDTLVLIDPSTLLTEEDLVGVYYCEPSTSTVLFAQFMTPDAGGAGVADVAPSLNSDSSAPPAPGTYPSGTLFEELCTCVDLLPAFQDPFEGYDPLNNWKPQRRLEINPGGPAAEPLGDELVINDANGRLFGINNRASDSTFDDITGVAFVMGAEGSFDDGSIAGDEYVGTLEFDLKEGYRTTANFNSAQLSPIEGFISADGTLDGALVDTENGEVLALFESVEVL